MQEQIPQQFSSPEDEIRFLREQIAAKERELLQRNPAEVDQADIETVGKEVVAEYGSFMPESVLQKERQMSMEQVTENAVAVDSAPDPAAEIVAVAQREGIRNALSVIEKSATAFTTDEVHRILVEHIKSGKQIQSLKEGVPPWQVLHMTLFEVSLPELGDDDGKEKSLAELISMMEQFYAGMQGVGYGKGKDHYVLEIGVSDKSDDIVFYVAVPDEFIDLFEKQILSLFPNAVLTQQIHDYNIFVDNGVSLVSVAELHKHPVYPLREAESFHSDPLAVLLNAFSKIEREGGGASLQILIKSTPTRYTDRYETIIKRIRDGMRPKDAIRSDTLGGGLYVGVKELVTNKKKNDDTGFEKSDVDQDTIEIITHKRSKPIVECNIRIAVSASTEVRAKQILSEIEATFHQFENTKGNRLKWQRPTGAALKREIKAYSFREFMTKHLLPLSLEELAEMLHFPGDGIDSSPQFKQSRAKTAAAPTDMPTEGTLLGVNRHRGVEKEIYVTEKDRARHFYIIGQTGTGKSVFMQNLIVQDIQQGYGVCMIDPHGNDIQNVLGAIPPEREQDVIYFDPSNLDRVIGLNMLEYDRSKPEQMTFVVNELFSIFQKLYGSNPESMGPMFEQYFRNSAMLVMDDPESGNTLMDISRVMADAKFRRLKLEKAKNPVVIQFWKEIATKAGGEASLENIVPYIVSKVDPLTANDYIRPIVGQQYSSFNFRDIMDQRKILLVNLSKGRLGEINSNLIGMIFVGKILMAALSRVDDPSMSFPPFYLHIDEFQNISTPAIASILSEARKYKLGLVVAHQFIAQLDEQIKDAVFGNVGSMSVFRVGPEDGHFLEKQMEPVFDANDIMNIPNYQAYVKILANGTPTKPFSIFTEPPPESSPERVAAMIEMSAQRYGRPRAEVEAEIAERYKKEEPPAPDLTNNPFAGMM